MRLSQGSLWVQVWTLGSFSTVLGVFTHIRPVSAAEPHIPVPNFTTEPIFCSLIVLHEWVSFVGDVTTSPPQCALLPVSAGLCLGERRDPLLIIALSTLFSAVSPQSHASRPACSRHLLTLGTGDGGPAPPPAPSSASSSPSPSPSSSSPSPPPPPS